MSVERKRRNKKNKLEEIQKPRGYERELEIDRIVGATDCTGDLMFLLKWKDCEEMDIIPASEVNLKNPEIVISFYEKKCKLLRKVERQKIILEEYEERRKLYVPPPIVENTVLAQEEENLDDKLNEDSVAEPMMGVEETKETSIEIDQSVELNADINKSDSQDATVNANDVNLNLNANDVNVNANDLNVNANDENVNVNDDTTQDVESMPISLSPPPQQC